MKKSVSSPSRHDSSEAQLLVDAGRRMQALHGQERYQEALDICLQTARAHPSIADVWIDAAVNCVKLRRWQDAIQYGQAALGRGGNRLELHDALAEAHGQLEQWDVARHHGLQALNMRNRRFGGQPVIPLPEPGAMPPLPSPQTRERNIIAFSLFGRDPKYCEPAVLNVQEQPHIYPHWVCRFYVDDSVPSGVISRLQAGGAQIVTVEGQEATQWPGQMWRLLALDDPSAHRVLFRDADSVISRREAGAVEQWIASGKRFHMMRDAGSNTELILAGLWGMVVGSLPPLDKLMERFMGAPLESRHFADQYFLREYVWPYARTSLMQHDSVFGFMDAVPFPDGERPNGFAVGCMECSRSFIAKIDLPDGAEVLWGLYQTEKLDDGQTREYLVCSYPGTIKNGTLKVPIPNHYAQWIEQGVARVVRLTENNNAH